MLHFEFAEYICVSMLRAWHSEFPINALSCGLLQKAGVARRQRLFEFCFRFIGGGLAPPL
jgi:hypothetical protein